MKTVTRREMGGDCDAEITASSSSEMANKMTAYVMEKHPDGAERMKNHPDENFTWKVILRRSKRRQHTYRCELHRPYFATRSSIKSRSTSQYLSDDRRSLSIFSG